uniref:non-ribosomal peptide synthetase n=1 Tax=Leptolyngbya sp. BC1307 TaxID=2029589 RepID=UPI000EFA492F
EAQAARSPEVIALICDGHTLTYQQLNAKANQLAYFLQHQGIPNEAPVALCFHRSPDMLIAIWGVLKAGGAYVPIDPSHPKERISHVLQDTQARWVLTQSHLTDRLTGEAVVLALDALNLASLPNHNLSGSPTLQQLAYCLYTSGSTGLPKGVEIEHRSLANYVQWAQQQYTHGEALAFPLFSPLTFDLTVTSIYVPLLSGGQVVIYPEDEAAIDLSLQRIFQDNAVDVIKLTPSHLALVQGMALGSRVKVLILGGEDLKTSLASEICSRSKVETGAEIALFNEYGPTEATVGCMIQQFDSALNVLNSPTSVPIGHPAAGASIYLLDESLKATPEGETGEIFIGGPGLARGYLNRPELTVARFIWREGERLYRTGDLGRWGENDELMYLGRCDRQIKLNGIRIEPGEIEAALGAHPQVKACVVTAVRQTDVQQVEQREQASSNQLVAYYVSRGEHPVTAAALRDFLAQHLPSNIRPTHFVLLKQIPLTPNGKVDLEALPAPQIGHQADQERFVAPQTPLEKTLAQIWQQVLSVDFLGVNDNFFDLGGDSIKAIQIAARISESGLAISPNQIFQHATVSELAAVVIPKAANTVLGDDLPSASLLASALAKLTEKQRNQLSILLNSVPSAAGENPWHNVIDIYPLTPVQSGMLFYTLADREAGVYLNQFICTLSGDVQPERLRQAWQQTVVSQPVLRTAVLWDGLDEPLQVVRDQVLLPWQQIDWRSLTAAEQKTRLAEFLQSDRAQGFDLTQAPAFRLALIWLSENTYCFICSSHHLLYDGWSLQLIWQDMLADYAALSEDASGSVRPFHDYVTWQQHQDLSAAEAFWRDQLQSLSEPTPLPAARSGDIVANQPYQQQSKQINAERLEQLTTLARQSRLTMNTLVQGAWALLLSHYSDFGRSAPTDCTQVIYGSVFSGRPADFRDIEKMVGLFINTLPVSVSIDSQQSLIPWLQARQQQLLNIREYEATPITAIQRWSNLPQGSPLFESIVAFENLTATSVPETGFDVSNVQYVEQSNYPLALLVFPNEGLNRGLFSGKEGCLDLRLLYDPGRFEAAAISRLLDHLEQLLVSFVTQPQCRLGDLPRLTPADQSFFNESPTGYPYGLCIHQLIEAQAAQSPQATAITFAGHSLTYTQLNQQANQLAHCLRSHGVTPGKRIALCLHRSLVMVVGILAILKAGAAYVPLDPTYPQSRLDYCLQDINPHLIVTQQSVLLSGQSVPFLYLDKETFKSYPTTNPENLTQPQDPAYIIYTSGSTGHPKGVVVSHRNLVHSTTARFQVYAQPVKRFLLLSSIAFDSSIAGLFWTLCQGGTLVLSPRYIEQDLQQLAGLIDHHQITHTLCVPTLYDLLLNSADLSHLTTLQTVIVAGEACSRRLAQQHYRKLPTTDLYNEYGPTEGSVWCSAYRVPAALPPGPISIGKPIPNTQIHLLNRMLQPVPIGAVGEIYISGDGVTQGYLNQPEKTADAYVKASCLTGSSRSYRTGDLGRYRSDGNLEWLGRCDRQVKIRGYRIELSEIEDALRAQESVQEAIVVAQSQPTFKNNTESIEELVAALKNLSPDQAEALLMSVETVATQEAH